MKGVPGIVSWDSKLKQDRANPADDLGASEGRIDSGEVNSGGIDGGGVATESEEGAKGWQRVFLKEVA